MTLKDLYETYRDILTSKTDDNLVARKCNTIALLQVTGHLLEEFFNCDYFNIDSLINTLLVLSPGLSLGRKLPLNTSTLAVAPSCPINKSVTGYSPLVNNKLWKVLLSFILPSWFALVRSNPLTNS